MNSCELCISVFQIAKNTIKIIDTNKYFSSHLLIANGIVFETIFCKNVNWTPFFLSLLIEFSHWVDILPWPLKWKRNSVFLLSPKCASAAPRPGGGGAAGVGGEAACVLNLSQWMAAAQRRERGWCQPWIPARHQHMASICELLRALHLNHNDRSGDSG